MGDFSRLGLDTSNEKGITQPMSIPRTVATVPDKYSTTYVIGQAKIQKGSVVKTANFFYFFVRPGQKIGILPYKK